MNGAHVDEPRGDVESFCGTEIVGKRVAKQSRSFTPLSPRTSSAGPQGAPFRMTLSGLVGNPGAPLKCRFWHMATLLKQKPESVIREVCCGSGFAEWKVLNSLLG